MIRLTTFGGPALCDAADHRIEPVLAQPRRLALLIYLAVEGRKARVRRDVVLGTFWPEATQVRASKALSQSMLYLRKSLGSAVLSAPGCEDLGVNGQHLFCDACALLAARESGRHAEAVALYAGDFLRGFYLDDAPEFEQWLEEQRLYFRRLASESAMAEARALADQGEAIGAATYARRAAELGFFAEPLVREQMELLASLGDYSGALQAFEQLRDRLWLDLEIDPAAETESVVERLRLAAAASVNPGRPMVRTAATPAPPDMLSMRRSKRAPSLVTAAIAVAVFAGVGSFWGLRDRRVPATRGAPVVLIDDFVEGGSVPRGSGAAIVADVVGKLSIVPGLAAKYVASPLNEPDRAADHGPLVLRGYVARTAPARYQVSIALSNGYTGDGVAQHVLVYDSAHFVVLDEVSDDIVDFTRKAAGRYYEAAQLATGDPANTATIRLAQRHRLRGDSLRGDGSIDGALAAFDAADSLLRRLRVNKKTHAAALAERAEIWLARAWVFFTREAFDPDAFRSSMSRALALASEAVQADPLLPAAHENRGVALYFLWLTEAADSTARLRWLATESETSFRNAVQIAPARARSWALLSASLHHRGRYAEARIAAERAYTANAYLEESSDVLQRLVTTSLETADPAAAKRWCAEIGRRYADSWPHAECRLQLNAWSMPTHHQYRQAAALVASFQARTSQPPILVAALEMLLGVVAARSGLSPDSALAIQDAALLRSANNPELAPMRAWLWQTLKRPDSARVVLDSYVNADPVRRAGISHSKRFHAEPVLAVH